MAAIAIVAMEGKEVERKIIFVSRAKHREERKAELRDKYDRSRIERFANNQQTQVLFIHTHRHAGKITGREIVTFNFREKSISGKYCFTSLNTHSTGTRTGDNDL